MSYPVHTRDTFTIISLNGEIDMHCSPQARDQILEHLGNSENVLVDLAAVDYIDSSGVANLVEGLRVAKNNELQFGLSNVSQAAMQVLKLARLDQVFPIYETDDDHIKLSS